MNTETPTPLIAAALVSRKQIEPNVFVEDRLEPRGGLTIHQYFAAAALTGVMANRNMNLFQTNEVSYREVAEYCNNVAAKMVEVTT